MLLDMPPSRRPLRVLHTADVHLESDGYGDARQQAAHQARGRRVFQRIVERALSERADLVLIAGDLFDHNRVSDEAVDFVRGELARLRQPVVILPGNHDALYTNSIHDRHDLAAGLSHVRVIRRLDGELVDLPELDAVVWGRAMEEHEPGFQPLAHIPGRDDRRWHLAMGHGFFYESRQRPDRSSPIFADEVRDTGWDYVALGHQHVQTDVSQGRVVAYYAGAPVTDWGTGDPVGSVLRIDLSTDEGIRVVPRPL
ncbi:MAG TPA: DNA repair exonuclease [Methylomirabilota bacterium]|nr:DNA repair exonuclease [Methylomirabilota bacterium]